MSTSNTKLKVNVVGARNLQGKNSNGKSDPYCEITVLDESGNKLGKPQTTKVLKATTTPQWSQLLEFSVGSSFSGLKLMCWDKHKFRSDKFLGQVTLKFNKGLLSSTEKLDDWFKLNSRSKDEAVSGDVHLEIQYGDLKTSTSTTNTVSLTSSSSGIEKNRTLTMSLTPESTPVKDLKVSAAFNTEETNAKLKMSTHVVVEEEPEDIVADDFDRVRDGPSIVAMEKLTTADKDITLNNKNLEVMNNSNEYSRYDWAKATVRVNGGRWYYEVKILASSSMYIGWCHIGYNPRDNNGYNMWGFDGYSQQSIKNGIQSGKYGDYYWNIGDTIGVGLDVDAKTMQFWKNGKDLGVAFTDVNVNSTRLMPCIALSRRAKVLFNFGKDAFSYPQKSYNMLHMQLTDKEIEQLAKIFQKYKDISNQDADSSVSDSKQEVDASNVKDSIHGQGLIDFQNALGAVGDDDPLFLVMAYKMKTEAVWEISRNEFMNTFSINACASMDKIKSKVQEWKSDILRDTNQFKHFYFFVFDYLKDTKKVLLIEEAMLAWSIVFRDRKWALWTHFQNFLTEENKKSISRDAWQQLWHFMNTYPKTLSEYDASSSWPILFDEFVEWDQKKKGGDKPKPKDEDDD